MEFCERRGGSLNNGENLLGDDSGNLRTRDEGVLQRYAVFVVKVNLKIVGYDLKARGFDFDFLAVVEEDAKYFMFLAAAAIGVVIVVIVVF